MRIKQLIKIDKDIFNLHPADLNTNKSNVKIFVSKQIIENKKIAYLMKKGFKLYRFKRHQSVV